MKVASLLKGAMFAGGAMQSTDEEILKNIKRSNISLKELGSNEEQNSDDVDSYTELILALPGDTVRAHSKSLRDMVDIGVNRVRMYQLIMLRQTEMNTLESRNKYGLQTRFRIMPRSFGRYELWGEKFIAVEYEEICVANSTMSFEEYLDCREIDLTVEILNNGRLFHELSGLCKKLGHSWFDVLLAFHDRRRSFSPQLSQLYDDFRYESGQGLWNTHDELGKMVRENIDDYLANDEGTNEMAKGKAKAVFRLQKDLHDLLFLALKGELEKTGSLDSKMELFLKELKVYSLLKKTKLLDTSSQSEADFNYDFPALEQKGFVADPHEYSTKQKMKLIFQHNDSQIKLLDSYVTQYGTSLDGLGRILMRAQYHNLIRTATSINPPLPENASTNFDPVSTSIFDR